MFAHKALAFVFVSGMDNSGVPLAALRAWRVLAVLFAVIGIVSRRRDRVVATVAAFLAYMCIVHVPLLYTHRYSVGAIDYPLALLAAVGLASATRSARRILLSLVASGVALAAGLALASPGLGSPMPERIPTQLAWSGQVDRQATDQPLDIDIPKEPGTPPWDLSMVRLDLAVQPLAPGHCDSMLVRYRHADEKDFAAWRVVRVRLERGTGPHVYTIGSTVPLGLDGAGVLRLEPECSARARVGKVEVILPRRERYYSELYKSGRRR